MIVELLLKEIKDDWVRETFRKLSETINGLNILKPKWKFYEITLPIGATVYPHRLGFRPKDIIVTSISNSESVIFDYDSFTSENLYLTASGACTVRFFAGSYTEMA